jgi:Lrp/AsnC family leucine-responsive transcriptional regulator
MDYKIDKKDKAILFELDRNARSNISRISKRCRLPKHVVRYRMAEMERRQIIRNYYTVVDLTCLGYSNFRVYWKFMDAPPDTMEEISKYLANINMLWWVARVSSTYDIVCAGWAKNALEVHKFLLGFKKLFRKNIKRESIAFYAYMKHFPKRYLAEKISGPLEIPYFGKNELASIDHNDLKILCLTSQNARMGVTRISKSMRLAETAVRERIKKLQEEGVIAGYKVLLDYEKMGMLYFWVHCELRNYKKIDQIEKAISENWNVVYFDRAIGGSDLEFGVQYGNPRELEAYLEELEKTFPDDIREIEYLTVLKNIRLNYLPDLNLTE